MEALPDLEKLSDAELKALPQQLQDITLKVLDGLGAELETGKMTSEETFAKSDLVMQQSIAQHELIGAEQMRRAKVASRKRMIIKLSLFVLVGIAALTFIALEVLKLPGVL